MPTPPTSAFTVSFAMIEFPHHPKPPSLKVLTTTRPSGTLKIAITARVAALAMVELMPTGARSSPRRNAAERPSTRIASKKSSPNTQKDQRVIHRSRAGAATSTDFGRQGRKLPLLG